MLIKCLWLEASCFKHPALPFIALLKFNWKVIGTARRSCSVTNGPSHVGLRTQKGAHPRYTKLQILKTICGQRGLAGGSSLLDKAVSTWSNLAYRRAWLSAAPLLPHNSLIWKSVRKSSRTSACSWKPATANFLVKERIIKSLLMFFFF